MRLGFAGLDHHPLNLEIKKATYGKSERRHEDVSNEVKLSHRQHQPLGQELIKEEELLNSILVISSFDFCSILNGEICPLVCLRYWEGVLGASKEAHIWFSFSINGDYWKSSFKPYYELTYLLI